MKKIILLAASLLAFATISASAETTIVTKEIKLAEYTSVDCKLPCKIEYTQGPASFRISASQKVLDHLVAAVTDGNLKICLDKTMFSSGGVKIQISSMNLNKVTINGDIEFEIKSGLKADTFQADLNGASDLIITGLKAGNAVITANGAASMEIEKSEGGSLEAKLQGAGNFDLKQVAFNQVKATVSGAGDCDIVDVECEKLEVSVNGAGGSTVTGHCKIAKLTVNGVGGINAKQLKAEAMDTSVNGIGKISR